jgi:Subtilase family/GEVED domain/Secretion system C-terminal sorting domain
MSLFYRSLLTLLLAGFSGLVLAQPQLYSAQQRARLYDLAQRASDKYTENYSLARAKAIALGRELLTVRPDGRIIWLRGISETGELIYYSTESTTAAGISTKTNSLYAGGNLGLSLTGGSAIMQNRLGEWDGAAVRATHVELAGRVTQGDDGGTGLSNSLEDSQLHATHVAGILIAAGRNPLVRGMAYGAKLTAYNAANDDAEMIAEAAKGLLVSNHSYGAVNGWYEIPNPTGSITWRWLGDPALSEVEDYKFGQYDADSRAWDVIANNAPNYLIVKSAGNSHGPEGPTPGTQHYVGQTTTVSSLTRSDQTGYDQVSSNSTAKNILTVGAVFNLTNGYNQSADVRTVSFSSWGPTDDGRIKPDLVGIGVNVLSSVATSDSVYEALSGTSMSSPQVAGSLFLLQELYGQRNAGKFMRSATLKAVALHTTSEAGANPGPDYTYGWGILNTEAAARVLLNDANNHLLNERTLATGSTYSVSVVASGRGPLTGTICWNDPAGTTQGRTFNDRTPRLVNDLDLRIAGGGKTSLPWTLNPASPTTAATPGDNIRDNVEQIRIDNPVPGQTYTITVSHKGTLSGSSQDYSLILSGVGGTAYCTSGASSSADTKIGRVQFGTLDQAGAAGCTTYTSFLDQTVTDIQLGQTIPLSVGIGTCGAAKTAVVKAFADWNADGDFADAGETLTTSGPTASGATFTANVTVPGSATIGQLVRLRLVAGETTDANAVQACGSYAGGETQEYLLRVVQASNDFGSIGLLSPTGNFCAPTNTQPVTVQVRNYGTARQTNVPVTLQIFDQGNTLISTLTSRVASLSAFTTGQVVFAASTLPTFAAGQTYRFVVTTNLTGDQNGANNTITETRTTAATPVGQFTAASCGTGSTVTLRNTGTGTAFWYDASNNLLAAGNQATIATQPAGGVLAGLDDFRGTLGVAAKSLLGGGTYAGNFGPEPIITTTVPITIESAQLYIAAAGQITFGISRLDGTPTGSSVTLDVVPTRNPSLTAVTNGQLVDDPNDPGATYPLNLTIPAGGNYKITISYANGASIFRSNVGVTGFPYQIKTQNGTPIVSMRGSLFNNATTNTVDTLTAAYYYLYNMQIKSANCPGAGRTPVAVTPGTGGGTATISTTSPTSICRTGGAVPLQAVAPGSPAGTGFQWLRNGVVIAGTTGPAYTATTSGTYTAQAVNTCPGPASNAIVVTLRSGSAPTVTLSGQTLTSSAATGNQWLLNGVAIPGAVYQTLIAPQTGRYSVQVSDVCGTATSTEAYVSILATEDEAASLFRVYPNPTQRFVTVEVAATTLARPAPTVRIVDLAGRTVLTSGMQRDGKIYTSTLSVSQLAAGTFVVVVDDNERNAVRRKFVKQ